MKELIFATNNPHKLQEVRAIFEGSDVRILSLGDVGCVHETVEDGATFYENARKKAREIAELLGKPAVADDTGLVIKALNGAPGVYSARFAPEGKRCARVLAEMEGKDDREAYFETCVVCVFPDGSEIAESARVPGHITRERRGENNFGYDPVFFCDELGKTYAEMTMEEKNGCSHRGRAFRKFKEALDKRWENHHDQ
ncbi:MAG: RdgB/HAM1 family non-canonical purine NTP pyrophosphatase [Clostridia bacterium]|nr:RdgB/HAM1 family non-canonical purine NTP pyrophosphatase [Clostridia bacterium]MBR5742218.1 RdgB/HAM1 family non-canonical purine NTP pyrophosphatase [Clostridia bacterium]